MKKLLCLLALLSSVAHAQNIPIKVLSVFTPSAVAYAQAQGKTPADVTTFQLSQANSQYTASSVHITLMDAGSVSGICCGSVVRMRIVPNNTEPTGTPSGGVIAWAEGSPAVTKARDLAGADVVLIWTDFQHPNDPSGIAGILCGSDEPSQLPGAKHAFVTVDIRKQETAAIVVAHEIGHINCMTHEMATVTKTGTSPETCLIQSTAEMNVATAETRINLRDCWTTPSSAVCYPSGHAAIAGIATRQGWQNCTFSNADAGGTPPWWSETMSCPFIGYANYISYWQGKVYDYICTTLQELQYFSPTGAAAMNAQAATTGAYHNTPISKGAQELDVVTE